MVTNTEKNQNSHSDDKPESRIVSNGMKILTVIPIKRGFAKDTLSYFTPKEVSLGSLVKVPLRNGSAFGIVIDVKDAKEIKADIKSLPFNLKKIDDVEAQTFLSEKFMLGAKKVSDYFAGSLGSTLPLLVPKVILENAGDFEIKKDTEVQKNIYNETVLIQSDEEERFGTYRSLIREEFARSHSIYFCLPTTEDILNAKSVLEKGIENFTYTLHSGLKKTELLETWKKIVNETHPTLIIATGSFLSIPKNDLGTIILEKESSRAYKTQMRPYIDLRTSAEIIARSLGVRLVLGDTLLRVETLWEEKEGKYSTLSPLKFRSVSRVIPEIVLMKIPEDKAKKQFAILGSQLKKLLAKSRENNEHIFLFCGRKGLYPTTVCSDCGKAVVCSVCESPVVLYKKKVSVGEGDNLFVCHHCGTRRDATELCKYCNSWRLNTLGIGTDRVEEEVRELLENSKVFVMDSDHVKNHRQAKKIRDEFYASPGSVMIGTELALPYLNQKVENSAVVSIDSYFSIPDYQINEKIFHILLSIRSITNKEMIIQTRKDNMKIFNYASKGNLTDFWRDEIEDRKSTDYPPFKKYIKLTLEGEKNSVNKEMLEIGEYLKPWKLDIYDAFNPGSQKKFTIHGLVTIDRSSEINPELLSKLRSLPQKVSVKVDPVTLL